MCYYYQVSHDVSNGKYYTALLYIWWHGFAYNCISTNVSNARFWDIVTATMLLGDRNCPSLAGICYVIHERYLISEVINFLLISAFC